MGPIRGGVGEGGGGCGREFILENGLAKEGFPLNIQVFITNSANSRYQPYYPLRILPKSGRMDNR